MAPHILAVLIFVVMFVLIVLDKIERQYVSLGCGLLMIVLVFDWACTVRMRLWKR